MAIKGAIIGDIVGSPFEFNNIYAKQNIKPQDIVLKVDKGTIYCGYNDDKTTILSTKKCHYTDDTVLSLGLKWAIQHKKSFSEGFAKFAKKYRNSGFGGMFCNWVDSDDKKPYGSYGNGSAMRVSYIADFFNDKLKVAEMARESALCTHNHEEGVRGAVATAVCIGMAKHDLGKDDILSYGISIYPKEKYAYSPEIPLSEIREYYRWNETCQGSVPAVIRCIYEANNYTEFIKNVLSLPCDTDTLCAIGGGIAEELFDNENDELLSHADEILEEYLDDYLLAVLKE